MYRYLSETLLSIWGGIYQEVELVDHMAVAFFIVGGPTILFLQQLHHLESPPAVCQVYKFSTSLPILVTLSGFFSIVAILVGMR